MATKAATTKGVGFPGDPDYVEGDNWGTFEPIVEDSGRKIDWSKDTPFFGFFRGSEMKSATNPSTGEIEEVPLLLFDSREGERVCTFPNYALTQALESGKLVAGCKVKLEWLGKGELSNGQTVNRMTISVAP